jgi:hemerythrin superfamily protein
MAKQDNAPNDEANGKSDKSTGEAAGANAAGQSNAAASQPAAGGAETDAIALLKADHRRVEALFAKYENATSGKDEIVRQVCAELMVHTALEEEIFYPACRRAASDEEPLDEAQVEHDSAKMLIDDLRRGSERDRFRDAKVSVLAEQIKHHVSEEEAPSKGIFAKAQAAGVNTPELARQLTERRERLMAQPDELPPPRPVSFQVSASTTGRNKEDNMANYRGNERDRDERGRFMEDEDRRGGYRSRGGRDDDDGRGWYGDAAGHSEAARRGWAERSGNGESRSFRSRDYDDDDRRYGASGGGRDRDERGRFTDDDDRGGRGQGGWFGDSRGHAEAARRGWEERGGGRYSRDYDDDDRRYGARGGGGGGGRDRDERGRFIDDDDRGGGGRGQGGWFGDSRGHAEAARRGWEERDGGRSARDYDDDDDRGGRGRGHGGWFGDSRGHAEAARRGWQDRR